MRFIFLILGILGSFGTVFSQENNYINYSVKDGLLSNTIYDLHIDSTGFLWVGSDAGLSRFDGRSFKNFTTQNGLNGSEVLQIFEDRKGRLLLQEFGNTNPEGIDVVENGIVSLGTSTAERLMNNMKYHERTFSEGEDGSHVILTIRKLYVITPSGVDSSSRLKYPSAIVPKIYNHQSYKDFYIINHDGVHHVKEAEEITVHSWKNAVYNCWEDRIASVSQGALKIYQDLKLINQIDLHSIGVHDRVIGLSVTENKVWLRLFKGGVVEVKGTNGEESILHFPNYRIHEIIEDGNGTTWVATRGHGLYAIPGIRIQKFQDPQLKKEIHALEIKGAEVYVGMELGQVGVLRDWDVLNTYSVKTKSRYSNSTLVLDLEVADDAVYAVGDFGCATIDMSTGEVEEFLVSNSSKSISPYKGSHHFVSGYNSLRLVDFAKKEVVATLYKRRVSDMINSDFGLLFGTEQGLYVKDGSLKEVPLLPRELVSQVVYVPKDSLALVGYDGFGLYITDMKGRILKVSRREGLTSDKVQSIAVGDDYRYWIGTNKGVDVIELDKDSFTVKSHTYINTFNGLFNDDVNEIAIDKEGSVYLATAMGLNKLQANNVYEQTFLKPQLALDPFYINGVQKLQGEPVEVPHHQNTLEFSFTGVHLMNHQQFTYHYRLNGLDTAWKKTVIPSVTYNNLLPGDYVFELFVEDVLGNKSPLVKTEKISIKAIPIFENPSLLWTIFSVFIGVVISFVIAYFLYLRRRHNEKSLLTEKISRLELTALQAQMNPHFIYNSLNAIQSYILTKSVKEASDYLAKFSRLIRLILTASKNPLIALEHELKLLELYLELEKLRFEEVFDFQVSISKSINPSIEIPGMLVQPLLENAINHGLMPLSGRQGMLKLSFDIQEKVVVCVVEDNGIGREAAAQRSKKKHQSMAMGIIHERIHLLAKRENINVSFEIIDLKDAKGAPLGTKVILEIPFAYWD